MFIRQKCKRFFIITGELLAILLPQTLKASKYIFLNIRYCIERFITTFAFYVIRDKNTVIEKYINTETNTSSLLTTVKNFFYDCMKASPYCRVLYYKFL